MLVSAVIVHYRAPELAAEAAHAVADDCAGSELPWEVVVVDNGEDAADRSRLRELLGNRLPGSSWRLLVPGRNLGYAGGLRHGVEASRGDVLLLMNPDVLVRPGCTAALVRALDAGAAAAGPRFYWDRGERMLLPPAEERTRRAELLVRLARSSRWAARALRRRWRRHARHHWDAERSLPSEALSGALLAVPRSVWREVGPFDDAFRLYFEETDWLRRLARRGRHAVHVPGARAVHLYDRSASREPDASAWFRRSQDLFARRWYGSLFAWFVSVLDRLPVRSPPGSGEGRGETEQDGAEGPPQVALPVPGQLRPPFWVELSPSPLGVPAAGERVRSTGGRLRWSPPAEIWDRLPPGRYRLQVSGADAREGPVHWLHKPQPPPDSRAGDGGLEG